MEVSTRLTLNSSSSRDNDWMALTMRLAMKTTTLCSTWSMGKNNQSISLNMMMTSMTMELRSAHLWKIHRWTVLCLLVPHPTLFFMSTKVLMSQKLLFLRTTAPARCKWYGTSTWEATSSSSHLKYQTQTTNQLTRWLTKVCQKNRFRRLISSSPTARVKCVHVEAKVQISSSNLPFRSRVLSKSKAWSPRCNRQRI